MNPIAEINEATALECFSRLDALVKPGTEVPSGMVKDVVLPKYRVPAF